MRPSGIITLTTDFGLRDNFVGQLKGAALSIGPDLRLVDLCHGVPPHDVENGAYLLETGYASFPPGTVHLAVVDPGVGTERGALVVRADGHLFVAPDNGLLSRVLDRVPLDSAHSLASPPGGRTDGSPTFEGRDRFAPIAAALAVGREPASFGPPVEELIRLPRPASPEPGGPFVSVPVIHEDRFGNLVLDFRIEISASPRIVVRIGGVEIDRLHRTFAEGAGYSPFLLVNSADYLEVAVNGGSAAKCLLVRTGSVAEIRLDA